MPPPRHTPISMWSRGTSLQIVRSTCRVASLGAFCPNIDSLDDATPKIRVAQTHENALQAHLEPTFDKATRKAADKLGVLLAIHRSRRESGMNILLPELRLCIYLVAQSET